MHYFVLTETYIYIFWFAVYYCGVSFPTSVCTCNMHFIAYFSLANVFTHYILQCLARLKEEFLMVKGQGGSSPDVSTLSLPMERSSTASQTDLRGEVQQTFNLQQGVIKNVFLLIVYSLAFFFCLSRKMKFLYQ